MVNVFDLFDPATRPAAHPAGDALDMLHRATVGAEAELGEKGIRVHALSPGPLATRAASGIDHFDDMLAQAAARAPTHQLATIEDVGAMAAFLASPEARNLTGGVHDIDGGYSITA